jgi:hypothetical protein
MREKNQLLCSFLIQVALYKLLSTKELTNLLNGGSLMKKKNVLSGIVGAVTISLLLSMTSVAEAGRKHHRHHHHHHSHHHHHHGGYAYIYNQPQPYYRPPAYGYNYYAPVPAPVMVPAPVYGYPPNVMLDIHTNIGHFMFSY